MSDQFAFFKIIFFNIFILTLQKLSFAVIVDSNICIDFDTNIATVYTEIQDPKVRYYLFTRKNLILGQEIINQNVASLITSNFNVDWPTRIYIGGWKVIPQNCKTALIKDAYLNLGDFNFIIADWSDYSTRDYIPALRSVSVVGELVGSFTQFLNYIYNVQYSDMYLIGLGFGAHVAGAAGQSIAPDAYDTIYALDAAGPGFEGIDSLHRLDPTDAAYVESIHTDMFLWGYGSKEPIGQAQFFPNNGIRKQPYCPDTQVITTTCSHTAALDYLVNSLKPEVKFCSTATTWNDVYAENVPQIDTTCSVIMGGEPSIKKSGDYYVPISSSGPLPA